MRKKANLCPECKAPIEPGWRFCLACGEVLQEEIAEAPPPDPRALSSKQEKAYRKGKVKCWQCNEQLKQPSPACPKCGADLLNPRSGPTAPETTDTGGTMANLPLPLLLMFVLLGIGLIGGVIYMMSNDNTTGASNGADGGFQMPSLPDIDLGSFFGDDNANAAEVPIGIDVKATEGRAISVDDTGLIIVRLEGVNVDVRLAGISDDFIDDCLGNKALARMRRILTEGAVIWVYLDGAGQVVPRSEVGEQSVYIWQVDSETDKIRFVNEEVIAGGEAKRQPTELTGITPADDLVAAAKRAESKERGRFAEGACD